MASKSGLKNSRAKLKALLEKKSPEERITFYAFRFQEKVLRDAPSCFVPSRELQDLFDALNEYSQLEEYCDGRN